MVVDEKGAMLVPRGEGGEPVVRIDLLRLKQLEARIGEVAIVTPHKAPELLATFNKACLDVAEYVSFLEAELVKAKAVMARWRAHLLLDVVPGVLQTRSLATSKDVRDAVIEQDEQYQQLSQRVADIAAAAAYLKTKHEGFEMAYMSVKKILGDNKYDHSTHINDPLGHNDVGYDMPEGFGNPKL